MNAGTNKVMVLNRDEGLECEVRLEHVSEFTYLGRIRYRWGSM